MAPLASYRRKRVRCRPSCCLSGYQRLPYDAPTHRRWHFTPNAAGGKLFPLPLWRRLMNNVLRRCRALCWSYGETAGDRCCERLSLVISALKGIGAISGRSSSPSALEGVNLCAATDQPGDSVWLEEPGYLGAEEWLSAGGTARSEEWLARR